MTPAGPNREPDPPAAAAGLAPRPRRRRRGREIRVPAVFVAVAALVVVGSVVAAVTAPTGTATRTVTETVPTPTPTPTAGVGPGASAAGTGVAAGGANGTAPAGAVGLGHPRLHAPFTVDGTRFAVFVNPKQPWTTGNRGQPLAPGQRLVYIEVLAHRLASGPVDVEALRYRLVSPAGRVTYPLAGIGTGAISLGQPRPQPGNALVACRLAFAVSGLLSSLSLEFEPTNGGGPTVAVPLVPRPGAGRRGR